MVERRPLVLENSGRIGELPVGDTVAGAESGATPFTIITSNTTAVNEDRLAADVSGGTFTITLPASPSAGDNVSINDLNREFCTTNLTVARNGSNIEGSAEDLTLDVDGITANMTYVNVTKGWKIEFTL